MKRFKTYLFFVGLIGMLTPLALSSAVIHVPEEVATIQAAVDMAQPGDMIHVRPGIYTESVLITKNGISLVAVVAQGSEERVVLDGGFALANGIHVQGTESEPVQDIVIRGFVVRRYHRGIFLEHAVACRVQLNETHDNMNPALFALPELFTYNGIDLFHSSFNTILQNHTHDNAHDGIRVWNGSNSNIFRGNLSVHNHPPAVVIGASNPHFGCGIDIFSSLPGITLLGSSNDNQVVENTFLENDWGIGLFNPPGNVGNAIRQNRVHRNHRAGIIITEPSNGNFVGQNDAEGNGLLNLPPSLSFDMFDIIPINNTWRNNKGVSNF